VTLLSCLSFWLGLTSCSSGPEKAKPGTPGFFWEAAGETFATRDYLKTTEHLRRVIRTENEFTGRALPWRLVVSGGLAQAYIDLADDFRQGIKTHQIAPGSLRKLMTDYRVTAETRSLEFAETFIAFMKAPKAENVILEFPFPTATSMAEIAERKRIQGGLQPSADLLVSAERRMIERAVPALAAAAVGAPGDEAKAQSLFQAGKAQVPREVFMEAMVKALYNQTELYSRELMNKPDRLQLFADQGLAALKTMAENQQNKELATNFEMLVKSSKQPQF
jgi:hypothetical protein